MRCTAMCVAILVLAACAASAGVIDEMKILNRNGAVVSFCAVVTAVFSDCCYVQDFDGGAGIKVRNLPRATQDVGFILSGVIRTDGQRERVIWWNGATACGPIIGGDPQVPLYLPNLFIGGPNLFYDARTGRGQKGAYGSIGFNNVGLLVTTSGFVSTVNTRYRYFYVDDGGGRWDGSGYPGVRVSYADIDWTGPDAPVVVGDLVDVAGISTLYPISGRAGSLIRTRHLDDIVVQQPARRGRRGRR